MIELEAKIAFEYNTTNSSRLFYTQLNYAKISHKSYRTKNGQY